MDFVVFHEKQRLAFLARRYLEKRKRKKKTEKKSVTTDSKNRAECTQGSEETQSTTNVHRYMCTRKVEERSRLFPLFRTTFLVTRRNSQSEHTLWFGARHLRSDENSKKKTCSYVHSSDEIRGYISRGMGTRGTGKKEKLLILHRVFRNLWDPQDCTPKNNEKKSCKCMSYLSSFMRCNEFSVSIIFTKDARNDHLAFEDKPAWVLSFIWLLSLSFLVFLEFVRSFGLFYFVVFQHFQSMLRVQ